MRIDLRRVTELRAREILVRAGLSEPDEVDYGESSIWLIWHEKKLAVAIDEIPVGGSEWPDDPVAQASDITPQA